MATPLTDALQSWAKCADCEVVIWCEPSAHDQATSCACGNVRLLNDTVNVGENDPTFTADDMEAILVAEK